MFKGTGLCLVCRLRSRVDRCRRRCEEENAVAIEEWEVSYLRRMANAEKARLYRIREKAKGAEKEAAAIAQMVTPDENGIR